MKLVGLVFLGLVASFIASLPLMLVVARFFPNIENSPIYPLVFFLITMPFGFFAGSIITGYFSYYEIEDKWLLLWMAPALYCNLLYVCFTIIQLALDAFIDVNVTENRSFLIHLWIPFLLGLFWYLASLAGVRLGYFLRGQIDRWWYGD